MKKYYIDSNEALSGFVAKAQDAKILSIDTEFTRQKTYYPILSLIQVAIKDEIFAIDCMAKLDLRDVFKMISDDKTKKILHSCSQDLQIFHREIDGFAKNVDDVQLMANFCGVGYNVGYSALVNEFFGVELDKKMQNSNWQKRPLSERQIEYAMLDVVYLEEIYQKLWQKIEERKRQKWFLEDMKNLVKLDPTASDEALYKSFIKNNKIQLSNKDDARKLRILISWREKIARENNVARRLFLSDGDIEKILREDFSRINLDKKYILQLKETLQKAQKEDLTVDLEVKNFIMNELQKEQFQAAKLLIEEVAAQEELKEQFLVTTSCVKDLILRKKPVSEALQGWRYFLFGKKLEKLIS